MTPLETYLGITPSSAEGTVLRLLIELGIHTVGADEGSLGLVMEDDDEHLLFTLTAGARGERTLEGKKLPIGEGITGLAAQTREVQMGQPVYDAAFRPVEAERDGAPQWVLAAPMLVGERLLGVVTAVSFRREARFTAQHAELYARVGAVAGLVIEQQRRLRTLEEGRPSAARPEEARLVAALGRLGGPDPARVAAVAALLESVVALLDLEDRGGP